jgi:hypothetical protein
MDTLLARDQRKKVVLAPLGELAGLTPEQLERLKSDPSWPNAT